MTVSSNFSLSNIRSKNRPNIETVMQDFEKSKLLHNPNKRVDSIRNPHYNWDIRGKAFRQEINPKLPIWVAPHLTQYPKRGESNQTVINSSGRFSPFFYGGRCPLLKLKVPLTYKRFQTREWYRITVTSNIKIFLAYKNPLGFFNLFYWVSLILFPLSIQYPMYACSTYIIFFTPPS